MTDCFYSSYSKEANYFLDSSREKRRKIESEAESSTAAILTHSFDHDPILDSLGCRHSSSKESLHFSSQFGLELQTSSAPTISPEDSLGPLTLSFLQNSKENPLEQSKENSPKQPLSNQPFSSQPGYKSLFSDDSFQLDNRTSQIQKLGFELAPIAEQSDPRLKPQQTQEQSSFQLYAYNPLGPFLSRQSQAVSPDSFHIQQSPTETRKSAEPSTRAAPLLHRMNTHPRVVFRPKRPHPDSLLHSIDVDPPTPEPTTQTFAPKKTVIRVTPQVTPQKRSLMEIQKEPSFENYSPDSPSNSPPQPSFETQLHHVPIITGISHKLTQMEAELSTLRDEQLSTDLSNKSCQRVLSIKTRHEKMRSRLIEFSRDLQSINKEHILDVCLLDRILSMQHHISILQKQLDLYNQELRLFQGRSSTTPKCLASLVIIEQPFPRVIKKQTRLSSPIVVKLIDSAKSRVQRAGKVNAFLVWEDYQAKKPPVTTESNTADMDDDGVARFGELRFPQGTRLKMVRLQFTMDVRYLNPIDGQWTTATIESETSSPFIIVTNENQWEDAEGILLKRDAFNGSTEIPWSQFVNAQQIHFVRATRQDAQKAARPLTMRDFSYLNRVRFGGKSTITQHDFDKFWSWFGKVLHKLRHQRVINNLWSVGYLFGFVTKEEAVSILQNREPGTFLVRFSERRPGSFAISFVYQNYWDNNSSNSGSYSSTYHGQQPSSSSSSSSLPSTEVRQSLVPTEEISGSRTLADFLLCCPGLRKVLQLDSKTGNCKEFPLEVLREFQSRPIFETLTGYEAGLCSALPPLPSPTVPSSSSSSSFCSTSTSTLSFNSMFRTTRRTGSDGENEIQATTSYDESD